MLLRALLMAGGHAGAWLLSLGALRRARTGSLSGDLTAAFILHALVVSLLGLLVGSAHAIGPAGFAVAGGAALALGLALGGWGMAVELAKALRAAVVELYRESPAIVIGSGLLLLAIGLRHAWNVWFLVPYTRDEYEYHLPRLAYWIQTGGLDLPDMLDTRSYFPAGQQLMQLWWVGFLRHDVVIEAASVESAFWGGAACFVLSRRLDVPRPGALVAALLFLSAPAVLIHASCTMNDMTAAAAVLSAMALLVRAPAAGPALGFAAMGAALGTGVHPTVAFASSGAIVLGILAWKRREAGARIPPILLALTGLGLLVGAYWYLRNWIAFGSPVYPVNIGGGAAVRVGPGEATVSTGPSLERMWGSLVDLFGPRLLTGGAALDPRLDGSSGWGWALPLLGLPALLWAGIARPAWRWPLAAAVLSLFTTLLLVEHDPWNARFVMWFAGILAVAAGAGLAAAPRIPGLLLAAAIAAVAAIQIWQTAVPTVMRGHLLHELTSVSWREREGSIIAFTTFHDEFRRQLDSTEGVLCTAFGFPVYALAGADFRRPVDHAVIGDPFALVERMKGAGSGWLFALNPPEPVKQAVHAAIDRGLLEPDGAGWFRLKRH